MLTWWQAAIMILLMVGAHAAGWVSGYGYGRWLEDNDDE